jgi:hypothetical protein
MHELRKIMIRDVFGYAFKKTSKSQQAPEVRGEFSAQAEGIAV